MLKNKPRQRPMKWTKNSRFYTLNSRSAGYLLKLHSFFWWAFVTSLLSVCMEAVGSGSGWRLGYSAGSIWWLRHVTPTPPALPLKLCSPIQYLFPPLLGQPITLCHRPKQRCHLTILSQIWKRVYLCVTATGLSLWRKTLSRPVCLCAVKIGALWKMRKKVLWKHVLRFK